MKELLMSMAVAGVLSVATPTLAQGPADEWNGKIEQFQVNRLPARATFMPRATQQEALTSDEPLSAAALSSRSIICTEASGNNSFSRVPSVALIIPAPINTISA